MLEIFFVVVCLSFGGAEVTTLSRSYEFSENQLVINYPWHDNTKLLYARCNSSQLGFDKKCIVAMMADAFENSTGVPIECEVDLKADSETIVNDSLFVFKFGSDKVIVVWMVQQNVTSEDDTGKSILKTSVKTSVVRMLDHCQTFESDVVHEYREPFVAETADQKLFNLVASKDTYELIIKNKINDAKNPKDFNGKVVKFNSRASWVSAKLLSFSAYEDERNVNIIVPVEPGNEENGYFLFSSDRTDSVALIMIQQDNEIEYKQVNLEVTSDTNYKRYSGISLANKAIGICHYFTLNFSTVCSQFNREGQRLLYTQISFDRQRQIPVPTIYNLRNGGFLMVVDDCPNDGCVGWNDRYALFKIEKEGAVDVVRFRFDTDCVQPNKQVVKRAFENKENRYCVARLCESKVNNSIRLDTSVRCFSSTDFSKCEDCAKN